MDMWTTDRTFVLQTVQILIFENYVKNCERQFFNFYLIFSVNYGPPNKNL